MSIAADAHESDGEALLTGATGFFGAFLLAELLATTARTVNCLVRAEDEEHARRRVRQNLTRYHRWDPKTADRVRALPGDLGRPGLGLPEDHLDRLAERTDVIYHNGAEVNHLLPLSHLRAANVDGTKTLVERVAARNSARLHYISASAVAEGHDSGYAESKRQSEGLIKAAADDGVAASIYRLPRLAPDTRTGLPNDNDIMIRLLDIILQVGVAPDVESVEIWVAVDVAASTVLGASRRAGGGETFALWAAERMSLRYVLEVAAETGFDIGVEPLNAWSQRVRRLGLGDFDVTLGVLGLDAEDVTEPADRRPDTEAYGELLEAPGSGREDLRRYFLRRRAGF